MTSISVKRAGLSRFWDQDDLAEVQAHHAGLAEPELDPDERAYQIAMLVDYHGYSLTDVGAMLGITRERVRQIARKAGAVGSGSEFREWDGDLNEFVGVSGKVIRERVKRMFIRTREQAKADTYVLHCEQMCDDVDDLRACAEALGRNPNIAEVADWLGVDRVSWQSMVGGRWSHRRSRMRDGRMRTVMDCTYAEGMNRLWYAAGFRTRPRGGCFADISLD